MAIERISQDLNDQYLATTSNSTIILEEGVTIVEADAPGNGIMLDANVSNNVVKVFGSIQAFTNGIISGALNTTLIVGKTANVYGLTGAYLGESTSSISNAGAIAGYEKGVHLNGITGSFTNTGIITGQSAAALLVDDGTYTINSNGTMIGSIGIQTVNSDVEIILGSKSVLSAVSEAIGITGTLANKTTVTNDGLITTSGIIAYDGSNGVDRLVNHGFILGRIELNDGDDRFDGRGGYVGGDVDGGIGNDRYTISDSRIDIIEAIGEGFDFINTSVSYKLAAGQEIERITLTGKGDIDATGNEFINALIGNAGDNDLDGGGGKDQLNGKGGNDRMRGGGDTDEFYFGTRGGHDRILDLDRAVDDIFVTGWKAIDNFADIRRNADNVSGGVRITVGDDWLFIAGVVKADLDEVDFKYAV